MLLLAYLIKSLNRDNGSFAILVICGQQGSGKTTLSKRVKSLLDPSVPSFFSPPKKNDDIVVNCKHSYLTAYENLSGLNRDMADMFCRISTKGGITKRKLYQNHGDSNYILHNPQLVNGIDEPSNQADFIDRAIYLITAPLSDSERVLETELDRDFEKDLPYLLGGLYQLMADSISEKKYICKSGLPRMTDFAQDGIALERVLGLPEGDFLRIYTQNREEQRENVFWGDELCSRIFEYLGRVSGKELQGTASQLIERLSRRGYRQICRSPQSFSNWLNRIEPLLKTKGIHVARDRSSTKRIITIYSNVSVPDVTDYTDVPSLGEEDSEFDI